MKLEGAGRVASASTVEFVNLQTNQPMARRQTHRYAKRRHFFMSAAAAEGEEPQGKQGRDTAHLPALAGTSGER